MSLVIVSYVPPTSEPANSFRLHHFSKNVVKPMS